MIIFGWPVRSKDIGPAFYVECPNCRNGVMFWLVKQRRWLSIYFIPLLPLSFKHHYLLCEICELSVEIKNEDVMLAKKAVDEMDRLEGGEITEDECMDTLVDLAAETTVFGGEPV